MFASSFNTLGGTWSGPCALFGFNLFSLSWTAFGVTHRVIHQLKLYYLTFLPSQYEAYYLYFHTCVKTLAKKVVQNICFFCFRYSYMSIIPSCIHVYTCKRARVRMRMCVRKFVCLTLPPFHFPYLDTSFPQ